MINRNNYEEYFLLLADNELSAEEATTVKQFAAQHPDLAEELDILMSCRLEVDTMPAFPKEKLLRTTLWNAENPEPVHTQMLLMLDEELTTTEKQQLQAKIAASTALQAEWQTLQQTKLVAEAIVHPNKELLRRNDRRVRPLLWMRWAAAAAVVAGLGWFVWMQQQPESAATNQSLATTYPTPKQKINKPISQSQNGVAQPVSADAAQPAPTQLLAANTPTINTPDNTHQQVENTVTKTQAATVENNISNNSTPAYEDVNSNTEAEPVIARLSSTDVDLTPSSTDADMNTQVAQLSTKPIALQLMNTSQKTDVFTGNKNGLPEEDDYITVGGARINKHKVRGLFRNVTRSVARTFSKSKMEPDVYATR